MTRRDPPDRNQWLRRIAVVLAVFPLAAATSSAQITRTWDGGGTDNNWSTTGNWSPDNVPDGTGEAALFTDDPVGQTRLTPNLSADVTIGQLQFSATAPSYTITGTGPSTLFLSPAASYGGVGVTVASGAANQTITAAEVEFLSSQTWDIGGTTILTVSATIEDDSVIDYGLTKNGTGTLVFPGDVRYDGPTIVNGGLLVYSGSNTSMLSAITVKAGILRATTSANALGNSVTRNTITLAGGALELANNTGQAFGSSSRLTAVISNSTIRSDRLVAGTGVTHTLGTLRIGARTLSVTAGALVTNGTAGVAFGTTTLTNNGVMFDVVNSGGANAQLTLGAVGQSGGARTLTKTGKGTLVLNGAGNYTGGTTLSEGAITLGVSNALGNGGFNFAGGTLNANDTTDSTIGALTLTTNSTLNLSPGGAAATLTFAGVSGAANGVLTITGWSGSAGGLGTNDRIIFSGGITPDADFLQHIHFDLGGGNIYSGDIGAGGELFPSAPPVLVPEVAGLTQSNATNTIITAGLTVGTVTVAPSSTVPAGSVISQLPVSGTLVSPGTPVDLVISSGPDELVADVTGAIEFVALPPNLSGGQFISQTHIRLMHEGNGTVTSGTPTFPCDSAIHDPNLPVVPGDVTFGNAITNSYSGPGLPAVGTEVYSVLLHFDPNVSGLPFDLNQGVAASGTITFNRPIIGVYVTSGALNATDDIFTPGGTTFPLVSGRDMEFNYDGDYFSISTNRLTLSLTMFSHNGGVLDEMRIILGTNSVSVTGPVLSAPAFDDGAFQVFVQTLNGKNYTLEFTDQLPATNWNDGQSVNGDNTVHALIDSSVTNSQRFYRVRVQ
jgi:autotransporter-associated beta strand protein